MVFEEIKQEVKSYLTGSNGCHDWDHTERVYKMALQIGEKEGADMHILELATILHDIGRPEQDKSNGKVCHAEIGAKISRELLEKHNLSEKEINKIVHCIECHRFRGNKIPESKEAKILFDADKLDAIGAIGIGRAFLFAGDFGARLHNKDVDIEKTKPYTKEDTAFREFTVKLSKVKDKMLTKEGRQIAEQRHKFMVEFFDRLDKEVDGNV